MFAHNKRLQYTVRVSSCNPGLANLLLEQFGGPQGELAAACRYFTQAIGDDDPGRKDMLFDIATEELSHLEVIGTLVAMLNRGAKGELAEGVNDAAEQYRKLQGAGNDSHVTQVLYGGGPALINSGGQLWNAGYIDTIGEPTADLRSNIGAEARAKIIYERLINVTDDPGVEDALVFLMTREVAHLQSFEKAPLQHQPQFPCRKAAGRPTVHEYVLQSVPRRGGDDGFLEFSAELRGGVRFRGRPQYRRRWQAEVGLTPEESAAVEAMALRTQSDPAANPATGADLGSAEPPPVK